MGRSTYAAAGSESESTKASERGALEYPPDHGLRAVLESLGVPLSEPLGHGGEAWVYALDESRVVRVLHEGQDPGLVLARQALVDELRPAEAPFALPQLIELRESHGRHFSIERRLPGVPVAQQLRTLKGRARSQLVVGYLDAASALASLHLAPREWFGDLIGSNPIRTSTWRQYLVERAAASLRRAGADFAAVDPLELAAAMPDCERRAFVHLDAFAGNMLAVGTRVTAVLDIGSTSAVGDPRLDPLASAVYLAAPQITPAATSRDVQVAMEWVDRARLAHWIEPARRWLAAFWAHAVDDPKVQAWCRSVLLT